MQKCVNQIIGLLVSSLLLTACNSTASNVSRAFKPVTPPVSGTSQQDWLKGFLLVFGWTLIFIALPVWRAINRLRERRHSQERPS